MRNIGPKLKPGWKKGMLVKNGEDKSNCFIYFVKTETEQDDDSDLLFLHSRILPRTDQTFKLQYGTELHFKVIGLT